MLLGAPSAENSFFEHDPPPVAAVGEDEDGAECKLDKLTRPDDDDMLMRSSADTPPSRLKLIAPPESCLMSTPSHSVDVSLTPEEEEMWRWKADDPRVARSIVAGVEVVDVRRPSSAPILPDADDNDVEPPPRTEYPRPEYPPSSNETSPSAPLVVDLAEPTVLGVRPLLSGANREQLPALTTCGLLWLKSWLWLWSCMLSLWSSARVVSWLSWFSRLAWPRKLRSLPTRALPRITGREDEREEEVEVEDEAADHCDEEGRAVGRAGDWEARRDDASQDADGTLRVERAATPSMDVGASFALLLLWDVKSLSGPREDDAPSGRRRPCLARGESRSPITVDR